MSETKRLLVCDCAASMALDPEMLGKAAGVEGVTACSYLCTDQAQIAREALSDGGSVLIACGQEADFFAALAEELGARERLHTVDIRDRAGWTDDESAGPKQAALLAETALPRPRAPSRQLTSRGSCLILGTDDSALIVAKRLSGVLAVTCLMQNPLDFLRPVNSYELTTGTLVKASGVIGHFEVIVDQYAPMQRSGRGETGFLEPVDDVRLQCDIILDMSTETPLFPAPEKREGYFHADPKDKLGVERAIFDASQMIGTFEKPFYVRFDPAICAHSRAEQTGCSRCLSVCPTGAIWPAGDVVSINADICAGCGACAAVCPSGAVSYDDPPVDYLFQRLRLLSRTFREAGGGSPRVLFHDDEHGADMIRLSARFGRGLPADVIPVEVPNVEGVGHAELIAAMGVGFIEALVLIGPRSDVTAPESEIEIARAILDGGGHNPELVRLVRPEAPDDLETVLYDRPIEPIVVEPILPLGSRREVTRLASLVLSPAVDEPVDLPQGAPYGAVLLDQELCTLCLSCVTACPVGALTGSVDGPAVNFQESACLQCGICTNICPESAITLKPQLNLSEQAVVPVLLNA